MNFLHHVLILAACCAVAAATVGVDVSSLFPVSSWECLRKAGYEFAIVRCYRSVNSVDPHCVESVANAWAGGMENVDLYMFPSPHSGNASGQIKTLYEHVKSHNVKFGGLWIDVEGVDKYWYPNDKKKNQEIFNELCTTATEVFGSQFAGVYVSHHSWLDIFGADYKDWGEISLWYARWDHQPGMGNWTPYGSFTGPTIHQYEGDTKICNADVDLNFRK